MENLEVKYVPFISEGGGKGPIIKNQHTMMKMEPDGEGLAGVDFKTRRKERTGTNFMLSSLALVTALGLFTLVITWLWGVPESVNRNTQFIKELADRMLGQSEQIRDLERQVRCKLPLAQGDCFGTIPRWHFDAEKGSCQQFSYSGCKGNANNFHTLSDCQRSCEHTQAHTFSPRNGDQDGSASVCSQAKDMGPCRATMLRWYYDQESKKCQEFTYGGCAGNDNNFISQHKCQERCVKVTDAEGRKGSESESRSESRCKLPQETGPCRAAFQKFHFDSESGTCKEFIYGGCDGNENRFDSNEDCLRACKKAT